MSKRAKLAMGIAAVVTLAIGSVAYAAIPSSGGVIHACYKAIPNPSGALRVIDDADAGAAPPAARGRLRRPGRVQAR